MTPADPRRRLQTGLVVLLFGTFVIAFATFGLATSSLPGDGLDDDASPEEIADAVERFRLRIDRLARVQTLGLGLVAAGGLLIARAIGTRITDGKGRDLALLVGFGAIALLVGARWASVDEIQFSVPWDRWLAAEGLAWVTWGTALAVTSWPRPRGAPPDGPSDTERPQEADRDRPGPPPATGPDEAT